MGTKVIASKRTTAQGGGTLQRSGSLATVSSLQNGTVHRMRIRVQLRFDATNENFIQHASLMSAEDNSFLCRSTSIVILRILTTYASDNSALPQQVVLIEHYQFDRETVSGSPGVPFERIWLLPSRPHRTWYFR